MPAMLASAQAVPAAQQAWASMLSGACSVYGQALAQSR